MNTTPCRPAQPSRPRKGQLRSLPARGGLLQVGVLALLGLGTACEPARVASMVDDLRFVAVQIDPPELTPTGYPPPAPQTHIDVTWEIADPGFDRPLEYLLLQCSKIEGLGDCLEFLDLAAENPDWVTIDSTTLTYVISEEGYHEFFRQFVSRGQTTAGTFPTTLTVPFSWLYLLQDPSSSGGTGESTGGSSGGSGSGSGSGASEPPVLTEIEGGASMLVCAEDVCQALLDEVDAFMAGEPTVDDGQALLAKLTGATYLADLPFDGNALATKRYLVSLRKPPERNENPVITGLTFDDETPPPDGSPLELAAGAQVKIGVQLEDGAQQSYTPDGETTATSETIKVRWYSTAGTLSRGEQDIDLSEPFESKLTAPATAGAFLLWVTAEDERFGSYFVRQELEVR